MLTQVTNTYRGAKANYTCGAAAAESDPFEGILIELATRSSYFIQNNDILKSNIY